MAQSLDDWLTSPTVLFLQRIGFTILVVIFLWIIWGFLLRRIKDNISPELHNALRTLGRGIILLLGLFWIGDEQFFIGAAAMLGTAIGFASSTTIGNFISGLYLLITNPFSVGDYIMFPTLKVEGIVEEISINYTKILSPQGIHVTISNQEVLGTTIHNTRITVPKEVVDKGKITWRDHEGDKFDSIDDVVDILKGIRTKYADKEVDYSLYPLVYTADPFKYKHSLTKKAFDEAVQKFSGKTAEKMTWFMLDRKNYQINLIVKNPYIIFDLKNEILGFLEERIEDLHEK